MNHSVRGRLTLIVLLAGSGLLGACRRATPPPSPTPAAAAADSSHALVGEVIAVVPERSAAMIHHEEIPGYMPAMTMEFTVTAADLARLKEGQKLRGRMRPDGQGNLLLEVIEWVDPVKEQAIKAAANQLRQDTDVRGKGAYRELGETAPHFTLYNQAGDVISINRFRGRYVVMNFIYTRCPIATMCPASTQHMIALQRAAKARHLTNLELVSLTLDPAYDKPPVLKEYADSRGADSANFNFLTGPESAVRDLLHQFGVIVEPGDNFLKHTLSTLLIDPAGRIVHRVDGTAWSPEDFLNRIPAPAGPASP